MKTLRIKAFRRHPVTCELCGRRRRIDSLRIWQRGAVALVDRRCWRLLETSWLGNEPTVLEQRDT